MEATTELRSAWIEIPSRLRDELVAHAVREVPNEACGLLAGAVEGLEGGPRLRRVLGYHPIRNRDRSPVTYTFDSREQLAAEEEIERAGWEVVGVFHSHTHTAAFPSRTDVEKSLGARLFYPHALFVLVSLEDPVDPELRAFTIAEDGVQEREVRNV